MELFSTRNVPIHDRAQKLQIHEILNLPVPHGGVSANTKSANTVE